jgi:hypothetical protein
MLLRVQGNFNRVKAQISSSASDCGTAEASSQPMSELPTAVDIPSPIDLQARHLALMKENTALKNLHSELSE